MSESPLCKYDLITKILQDKIAKLDGTKGAMLVPVVSGSDKTTVSIPTGHQKFHPVYASPRNLSNLAKHGHGCGVLPVTFLPIPKGIVGNCF